MILGINISSSIRSIKGFNETITRPINCLLCYHKAFASDKFHFDVLDKCRDKNGDPILYKTTFYLISLQELIQETKSTGLSHISLERFLIWRSGIECVCRQTLTKRYQRKIRKQGILQSRVCEKLSGELLKHWCAKVKAPVEYISKSHIPYANLVIKNCSNST